DVLRQQGASALPAGCLCYRVFDVAVLFAHIVSRTNMLVQPRARGAVILLPRVCLLVSLFFFFSSRRRHTRLVSDWSSDVCSSDLRWSRGRRGGCRRRGAGRTRAGRR